MDDHIPMPKLLLSVISFLFAAHALNACPACNIYNYLGSSIGTSSNVVVGQLVAVDDNKKGQVKIEIIRTLKGSYLPKTQVEMQAWNDKEDIGKTFVFSDPKSFGAPAFHTLPLELEDEVQFLIKWGLLNEQGLKKIGKEPSEISNSGFHQLYLDSLAQYEITNAREAIRRVQGISNQSRDLGMNFLSKQKPLPSDEIIQVIESVNKDIFSEKDSYMPHNRLGNLIEALMLSDDQSSHQFLLQLLDQHLRQNEKPVDWSKISAFESPEGQWLATLIGCTGEKWTHRPHARKNKFRKAQPQLVEKQKQLVIEALPRLKGSRLAETVYALYETGASSPEELLPLLKNSEGEDEFALGVLWVVRDRITPWAKDDKALNHLKLAASLATKPELKKLATAALERATKLEEQNRKDKR
jgi:hypothetical protein